MSMMSITLSFDATMAEEVKMFEAQCVCGKNKFAMKGGPTISVVCHCTTCREHSGAPFLHTAAWGKDAVEQTEGSEDDIVSFSMSEGFTRRACGTCGGVAPSVQDTHGLVAFHLGTIKGAYNVETNTYDPVFAPACHLFYGSRVINVVDGAPKMAKKAPQDGILPEE